MTTLDDLLTGVPPQNGNGGKHLTPRAAQATKPHSPVSQIDRITASAKRVLEEEAQIRADKTERLKAARQARDGTGKA